MNLKVVWILLCGLCFITTTRALSLNEMSLEEKVGQILMAHFQGEIANEDAKKLIQEVHIGGIIYYNFSNSLHSCQQVSSLSASLQELTKRNRYPIPLFIATDQEGGPVSRLYRGGFTLFPGNKALAMTNSPHLAELAAFAMGQEMRSAGVNMNLAPVVDVQSNPKDPIIGIRSFSSCPKTVTLFAKRALAGYRRAGVITSLKHFPGHGDVSVDPHEDLPVVTKSKELLLKTDLYPFQELAERTDAIVTAHILVPALDPTHCATFSKPILSYLRNSLQFNGLIISDSLIMDALLKQCSGAEEAALRAFDAGCNILLLGGKALIGHRINFELTANDVQKIHASLVQAIRGHRAREEHLEQSVQKILRLKNQYALSAGNEWNALHVDLAEHQRLAQKIASLAIQASPQPFSLPLSLESYQAALFSPTILRESLSTTPLLTASNTITSHFFKELEPTEEEKQKILEEAKKADFLIFCSYNAWKNKSQAELIQSMTEMGKPMLLIVTRDPIDASLFPQIPYCITTFSPTTPSLRAAAELIITTKHKK